MAAKTAEPPEFTAEEIREYREIFALFDGDGNGNISASELATVMAKVGKKISDHQLSEIMKSIDLDGNGTIEFDEFLGIMKVRRNCVDEEAEFRDAFRVFDKDGNGVIDKKELKEVMAALGENLTNDEVNKMMKEADLDGDGLVNYEEFVILMKGK